MAPKSLAEIEDEVVRTVQSSIMTDRGVDVRTDLQVTPPFADPTCTQALFRCCLQAPPETIKIARNTDVQIASALFMGRLPGILQMLK